MWSALGAVYSSLDRRQEAIKCFERAVNNVDREGTATRKLAKLYRDEGNAEKAARCYQKLVSAGGGGGGGDLDSAEAEALLFLANYHKGEGNYDQAAMYCSRLLEFPGQEEAKALLRDIRSRIS
jgi:anaphase-promoting complex subunit 8